MKKRLSIGTLAFALAFGLAATACGNGAGSGAVGGPNVGGGGNGGGNGAAGGNSISIAGMTTGAAINAALAAGDVTVTGAAVVITDGDIRPLLKSTREFIAANPRNKIKPQPEPAVPAPVFFGNYPEALDETYGVFVGNAPA